MRIWLRVASLVAGLSSASAGFAAQPMDHFHWRPAAPDGAARPWAVLLPGASGLSIFEDDQHYFQFAKWLNGHGVDVLVVDYRQATKLLPDTQKGKPGPRIARIVAHALTDAQSTGRMPARCPGLVFGWSLGGEGLWQLAAEGGQGLRAAIGYYPSVRGQAKGYVAKLPVLVLQGGADRMTKSGDLAKFLGHRSAVSAPVTVHDWSDATHGFDVASLGVTRRDLKSDPAAAREAKDLISTFVDPIIAKGCDKE